MSELEIEEEHKPLFSAVSNSARQLFLLLRCIFFVPKARVLISDEGIRFSVEDSSVMEAMAFLEKSLFSTYNFNAPSSQSSQSSGNESSLAPFSVSLPSLLETLQMFGLAEQSKANPWRTNDAFSSRVLGVSGVCRLLYQEVGSPLVVTLQETGVVTTCELLTYEPSFTSDIPFSRDELALKIIMAASHLLDAISELAANNPDNLTIVATQNSFTLSSSSSLGAAVVQFHRDSRVPADARNHDAAAEDAQIPHNSDETLLETFLVPDHSVVQSYKFTHILSSKKALAAAIKVSVRVDEHGVLSLQFMIENIDAQGVSFVDFRFVPLVREDIDDNGQSASRAGDASGSDDE